MLALACLACRVDCGGLSTCGCACHSLCGRCGEPVADRDREELEGRLVHASTCSTYTCSACGATLTPGRNIVYRAPSFAYRCDGCAERGDVEISAIASGERFVLTIRVEYRAGTALDDERGALVGASLESIADLLRENATATLLEASVDRMPLRLARTLYSRRRMDETAVELVATPSCTCDAPYVVELAEFEPACPVHA